MLRNELTLQNHPLFDALLESTILAPVPLGFGDLTGTIRYTRINPSILNSPFKKTFTPLARYDPVM